MEKLFVVIVLLLSTFLNAQEVPYKDGKVFYEEVVQVPSTSATELTERGAYFFNITDNAVVESSDSASISGTVEDVFIAGKDELKIKMRYDLILEFKNSRYKITCKNIAFTPFPDPFNPQPLTVSAEDLYKRYMQNKSKSTKRRRAEHQREFLSNMDSLIRLMISDIKEIMANAVPQVEEDW